VAVPAFTFVATVEAVIQAGATPVLFDVALNHLDEVVKDVDAGVCVHLYGLRHEMKGDVPIIDDACQAHGMNVLTGVAQAYSFYPGKNLGAWGDAGAIVTDSADLADHARLLRHHGQRERNRTEAVGSTERMDTIQAAVLLAKLPHLSRWNEERAKRAAIYREAIGGKAGLAAVGWSLAPYLNANHLCVFRSTRRDQIVRHCATRGIEIGVHYPRPIHAHPAFAHLGRIGQFPYSERAAREVFSLPLWPEMTDAQQERVINAVKEALA
jgi:dTDP-4-amino-4,6-dideoxygalactose transaminase